MTEENLRIGLTKTRNALDRIVWSRDTKHFKINFALCEALETILLTWGRKLRWLSYETPRSVTEETMGRIELQRLQFTSTKRDLF